MEGNILYALVKGARDARRLIGACKKCSPLDSYSEQLCSSICSASHIYYHKIVKKLIWDGNYVSLNKSHIRSF